MRSILSVLLAVANDKPLKDENLARQLSAAKVKQTQPGDAPITLPDGGGLSLVIAPTGAKVWRYRFRLAGKGGILTLGQYPEVSLSDAREAHRGARWLVERGIAPLAYAEAEIARHQAEQAAQRLNTFGAVCEEWMARTDGALAQTTVRHRKQMLNAHVLTTLGARPIAEITRRELRGLLLALDSTAPVTGRHCRLYIKQIFDWALDAELIQGNPTPQAKALPNQANRAVVPRKALSIRDLGAFLKAIEDAPDSDPLTKAAMRLLILTWSRTNEVVGARWAEFDLDSAVWVIPAARMKAREQHTVYLATQIIELLRELRKISHGEFLFPNRRRPDDHMSRMTLSAWRKRHGFADDMEIHGFRAVGSTWANGAGCYRPDIIEAALAHREADRIRAAYNRADFSSELRKLWQDWADLCAREEAMAGAGNVVHLRANVA